MAICILSLLSSYVQVHTGAGDSAHRRLSTSASRRRGVPATPNGRMSWLNKSVSRPRGPTRASSLTAFWPLLIPGGTCHG